MGRLDGKVAFITGAARGQGRSHAAVMAGEGADIIALDLCDQVDSVEYPMATPQDLAETVRIVEAAGRRIVARQADVRDLTAVQKVVVEGVSELGRLDIVLANAGIMPVAGASGRRPQAFYDAVDVMLTGVYHTCEAAIPTLVDQGEGGSIVITSSSAGLRGFPGLSNEAGAGLLGYTAAKHGVVGLMRVYANVLGRHSIRCNTVHPSGVNSPMAVNDTVGGMVADDPTLLERLSNALPVRHLECIDVTRAILYLCSDDGRYVTGVTFPVDAGFVNR